MYNQYSQKEHNATVRLIVFLFPFQFISSHYLTNLTDANVKDSGFLKEEASLDLGYGLECGDPQNEIRSKHLSC